MGDIAGWNFFGQLGLGHFEHRNKFCIVESLRGKNIVAIASRSNHTAAISASGKLYVWGCNDSGQLGLGTDDHTGTPTELPGARIAAPADTLNRPIH